MAYLCEVYHPSGSRKCFPTSGTLQRERIRKSLARALSEITTVEPDLAQALRVCLHLGEFLVFRPGELVVEVVGE